MPQFSAVCPPMTLAAPTPAPPHPCSHLTLPVPAPSPSPAAPARSPVHLLPLTPPWPQTPALLPCHPPLPHMESAFSPPSPGTAEGTAPSPSPPCWGPLPAMPGPAPLAHPLPPQALGAAGEAGVQGPHPSGRGTKSQGPGPLCPTPPCRSDLSRSPRLYGGCGSGWGHFYYCNTGKHNPFCGVRPHAGPPPLAGGAGGRCTHTTQLCPRLDAPLACSRLCSSACSCGSCIPHTMGLQLRDALDSLLGREQGQSQLPTCPGGGPATSHITWGRVQRERGWGLCPCPSPWALFSSGAVPRGTGGYPGWGAGTESGAERRGGIRGT